jgi:signal peptidase
MSAHLSLAPGRGPGHSNRAHGAHGRRPAPRRGPSPRDAVVTAAGIIGFAAIAWIVVSWIFSLQLIVFVTGSMTPTMPTGAAAIVQTVAAGQLHVGDVVTVPKPSSGVPVTHRIVAIAAVDGDADARSLTLKGDANSFADRDRYVVSSAGRVVASMPGAGEILAWAKSPIVMMSVAVLVSAIAAWALWPSTRSQRRRDHP